MHIIEIKAYKFDELSDKAKQRAREWWREGAMDDQWWDFVHEDAARMADLMGIDLRTRKVTCMDKSIRWEPCIYWSGFYSQGDGACFEGTYRYNKGAVKAIKAEAPEDKELHRIAKGLQNIQSLNFYRLRATVKHTGHYYHELCTTIEVEDTENPYRDFHGADKDLADLLRDFMRWIYRQLEQEYEWQMADEQVDEAIRINEYDFDEDGRRV